ncbi:hypothetical protein MKX01_027848 [Papaver californicum]|nr:hypothetical protein MKX01_027848 [Papaver californicum]
MSVGDEDVPLVMPDSEVISEVEMGLAKLLSLFTQLLVSVPLENNLMSEADENMVLQSLLNIEWMSNISTKMDLMRVFVLSDLKVSEDMVGFYAQDEQNFVWEYQGGTGISGISTAIELSS